jgi:hypothetical protein
MVTKLDYNERMVQAAHAVLLELVHVLGEYREGIALVGGWVPGLLLPQDADQHIGSMDVDIALDHQLLEEAGYETICAKLESRGYRRSDDQPFIFFRDVPAEDKTITVEVDLLAGEYEGTARRHRTQRVQDAKARKARGCDLVFPMAEEIRISGKRPDGYEDAATIKIAGIVPFIIMKAMAMADRQKEKDAYDIYFVLRHYPGGPDELIKRFEPHIEHGLVREGLEKLAEKFESPNHIAPNFVADFEDIEDAEEREMLKRDVFERMDYLLRSLGFSNADA